MVIKKKKENNFVVFERCEPIDSTREDKENWCCVGKDVSSPPHSTVVAIVVNLKVYFDGVEEIKGADTMCGPMLKKTIDVWHQLLMN